MIAHLINVLEAKPNKMFTEDQRQSVRFLRYSCSVPCAECGRRSKAQWTLLCSFRAESMGNSIVQPKPSGKVHLPFAPVCQSHLLAPADIPGTKPKAGA